VIAREPKGPAVVRVRTSSLAIYPEVVISTGAGALFAPAERRNTPPLLCAEVMSSDDQLSQVERVLRDYVTMGVEHMWLLDPQARLAYTYDRNGLHPGEPELSVSGTGIRVNPAALFDQIHD
jgi:Uma2 family endonuclease